MIGQNAHGGNENRWDGRMRRERERENVEEIAAMDTNCSAGGKGGVFYVVYTNSSDRALINRSRVAYIFTMRRKRRAYIYRAIRLT